MNMTRWLKICFSFLCCSLAAGCSRTFEPASSPEPTLTEECRLCVQISDEMAVRLESGEEIFIEGAKVRSVERLFPDAGEWEPRHRAAGLHRWYSVSVDAASKTKAIAGLDSLDGVLKTQLAPKARLLAGGIPFNDVYAFRQWGLFNTGYVKGVDEQVFVPGIDINVVPVWKEYTAGSPDVIVAVVDGGAYYHPDLKGVIIPAGENGSRNFVDSFSETPYLMAPDVHGTAVSSVIGAINNNGEFFCGVAGGSDGKGGVRILNCQIMAEDSAYPDSTFSSSVIGDAIVWAADHGAVICNNSWGYVYDSPEDAPEETPGYISDAIDYFIENAGIGLDGTQTGPMKGGLVVFAAGNEDSPVSQPAMYERVLAVGAVGPCGERALYSNYGDWVDICAPGGNVDAYSSLGGNAKYSMILGPSTDDESMYLLQGTSLSCPYVSGVAALMVSYFGGEGFTPDRLREMLMRGARYGVVDCGDKPIGPLIDAMGAFGAGSASPVAPEDIEVSSRGSSLLFEWKVTGTGSEPTYACLAEVSLSPRFEKPLTKTFVTADREIGERVSFEFAGLEYNTVYYARLTGVGVDPKDRTETSGVFEVMTGRDLPPYLFMNIPDLILDGEESMVSIDLDYYFRDPGSERLKYIFNVEDNRPLTASLDGAVLVLKYKDYGQTRVSVTAEDYAGNRVQNTFRVLVRASGNHLYDLFPVPVEDILNIRPGSPENVTLSVRISSVAGSVVFDKDLPASAFDPARVDMSQCAPGVYNINVSGPEGDYSKSVVKR